MTYHWISVKTGEIVPSLRQAIRVAISDWCNYHVVNIRWSYNKEGWCI